MKILKVYLFSYFISLMSLLVHLKTKMLILLLKWFIWIEYIYW